MFLTTLFKVNFVYSVQCKLDFNKATSLVMTIQMLVSIFNRIKSIPPPSNVYLGTNCCISPQEEITFYYIVPSFMLIRKDQIRFLPELFKVNFCAHCSAHLIPMHRPWRYKVLNWFQKHLRCGDFLKNVDHLMWILSVIWVFLLTS